MNLILTSDLPSTGNDAIVERMRDVAPRPRVAWIPPSTDVGRVRFIGAQQRFRNLGFDNLEYCDIDLEVDTERLSELPDYDIVYLSGGDPVIFRTNIFRTGLPVLLKRCLENGRLVVAASGGSLQFTKNLSLFRLLSASVDEAFATRGEYAGLSFVGYELLPHRNRFEGEFLEKVRAYSARIEHDIVALDDGAAVVHCGPHDYCCFGTAVRYRNGVKEPIETAA